MSSGPTGSSRSEHFTSGKHIGGLDAHVQVVRCREPVDASTAQPFVITKIPAAPAAVEKQNRTCIAKSEPECGSEFGSFISNEDSCTAAATQFSSFSTNSTSLPSFITDYSSCSTVIEENSTFVRQPGFEPEQQKQQQWQQQQELNEEREQVPLLIQCRSDALPETEQQQQQIAAIDVETKQQQQQQQHEQSAWFEVVTFALPMLATLAADPLASLVDTAYVGHLGAVQLAGVGMASNIFTSITRLFNAPLLAVTTSSVAAAAAAAEEEAGSTAAAAAAVDYDGSAEVIKIDHQIPGGSSSSSTDLEVVVEEVPSPGNPLLPAAAAAAAADEESDIKEPLLQMGDSSNPVAAAAAAGSSTGKQQQQQQANAGLSSAVSAALWLALAFSLIEVAILAAGSESLAAVWGAPDSSPLHNPTQQFLVIRGFAAPVTVLLLVLQGVFRGMKDAKTPFYATLVCNILNIALEPLFIFRPLSLGVRGSALATAIAQSLPLLGLFVVLHRGYGLKVTKLMTNGLDWKSLGSMFAPTGFLLLRTISISAVFATATSLVARAGPLAAAAHQVAFQVWLASSLLADSLAVACQTLMARSTAAGHHRYARKIVTGAVAMATGLGVVLAIALGAGMHAIPGLFTRNLDVLRLSRQLMPIVAVTQPLNALAFVLDGVLYGAGGFKYASAVMLLCAAPSLGLMFVGQGLLNPADANSGKTPATQPPELHADTLGSTTSLAGFSDLAAAAAGLDPRVLGLDSNSVKPLEMTHAYALGVSWSDQGYNALSSPAWTNLAAATPAAAAASSSGSHLAAAAAAGGTGSSALSEAAAADVMPAAVMWVWAGLVMLMFMRAVTILVPLLCRCYPFRCLYTDITQQQQQQHGSSSSRKGSISSRWFTRARLFIIRPKTTPAAAAAAATALKEPLLPEDEESGSIAAATDVIHSSSDNPLAAAANKQRWGFKSSVTNVITSEITYSPDEHLTVLCGESPGSSSSSSAADEDRYDSSYGSSSSSSGNLLQSELDSPGVSSDNNNQIA